MNSRCPSTQGRCIPRSVFPLLPQLAALGAAALLGGACSSDRGAEKDDWSTTTSMIQPPAQSTEGAGPAPEPTPLTPAAPPAPGRFDPKAFADQHVLPENCERAARQLKASSSDTAWTALKACVAKGNFTAIRQVVSEAWAEDLKTRRDAPAVLAKIIASRGGSIGNDLPVLQEKRIPLFTLAAAMSNPAMYKGRYIVLRTKVSDPRISNGVQTLRMTEYGLGSEGEDRQVGKAYNVSGTRQGSGSVSARSDRYGSASARGEYRSSGSSSYYATERKYDNVSVPTGRQALGRLSRPDPFLEPEKEFIVLAKFNGVRKTPWESDEDEEEGKIAVLSIVSYYLPNPLVVY